MRKSRVRRNGFTLLEVILALGIFLGAIAALSRLLTLGLESAEHARYQAEALGVAETRYAEAEAGLVAVDGSPIVSDDAPDWQATLTEEAADSPNLNRVDVVVENISSGPARGMTVRLVRLRFVASTSGSTSTTTPTTSPTSTSTTPNS